MDKAVRREGVSGEVGDLAGSQACPLSLLMPSFPGHTSVHWGCGKEEMKTGLREEDIEKGNRWKDSQSGQLARRSEKENFAQQHVCLPQHPCLSLGPCQLHINTANLWKVSLLPRGSPSLLARFISVYLAAPLSFLVLGKFRRQ